MAEVAQKSTAGASTADRSCRAMRVGRVVSDKGDKTIKVIFAFSRKHPKYGKYMRRSTTLHAHDERNEAKIGDTVELMSCRPLSKTKHWRLVKVVTRD